MKKIIITQILIAVLITIFDKACEIILNGPCVWDIQDVVVFTILCCINNKTNELI